MCDEIEVKQSNALPTKVELDQKAKSNLREKYLKVLLHSVGKKAVFHLHDNTKVEGVFRGCDYNSLHIHVQGLRAPSGEQGNVLLRTSDILYFTLE